MMGKTRKVSKGHSSGFVPDYRHVVETMGDSEGLGSSGWMDVEMSASADSCAPRRKAGKMSNRRGYEKFGMPYQVLSLSNMSRSERKNLEMKLRKERQQIINLQKRIASVDTSILSPNSDIRSSNGGPKKPSDSIRRPVKELDVLPDKNKAPPARNGSRAKGPGPKRTETAVHSSDTSSYMLVKQCEGLVSKMLSHKFGPVFAEPVDVVKLKIPDYFSIIKHPMDLGTVKRKLLSGEYSDLSAFAADVRLTFTNAMTYNPPDNDVHFMAKTLSKFFEVRWKPIEKKILTSQAVPPKYNALLEKETITPAVPSKKLKTSPPEHMVKSVVNVTEEPVMRVISDLEKHKLRTELESADLPDRIIDFLKENSNAAQDCEDEIEIDLDALTDDTLFRLRKLLDECRASTPEEAKEPNIAKRVPVESQLPLQKVKEHPDICMDIKGNDQPTSSSPQVDIGKDVARNSCRTNSSCSTSDSASSSSDSGSEGCSGELDVGKDSAPVGSGKESLNPGTVEQKKDGIVCTDPMERDACLEAESAPPERTVSPEKLYRAALLRSRFADTIIRAQEKTQERDDKLDPEKSRIEKEMVERRRKEEKARLQAEAKAVEEARRKAEEEAAAEARCQRELEREAARQALLQMEKTVDINESSQFLEDLEMLRAVPDEHLGSFTEEITPDDSQNGLGNFNFQASSNPLEQLGLYIKRDDEEDEEPEPHSATDAEGDID